MSSPRILIVTAPFGEGHNSAARNTALALGELGAECHIADPCLLGAPYATEALRKGYRFVTNHLPRVWEQIYRSTEHRDFRRQLVPGLRKPERTLTALVENFRPNAIVSTYPIYPYFLERTFAASQHPLPVFTIVTDSIEINASWTKAPSDFWLVTDERTRDVMIREGLPPERVIDTGFPVHPDLSRLAPIPATAPVDPFHVLYFPTAKRPDVRKHSEALLDASPSVHLTMILGKNIRPLYRRARDLRDAHAGRVRIIGWTRRVPELLTTHHIIVGKAGGATVHEAIAACCPMLVHHLVPGQEEGNLQLLETIGGGMLAESPEAIHAAARDMLADNAAGWRRMKRALSAHSRNNGALNAARFVLDHI